jgi:hypothetical protein
MLVAALTVIGVSSWTVRTRKDLNHPRTVYILQGLLVKAIKTLRAIQLTCGVSAKTLALCSECCSRRHWRLLGF